MAGLEYNNKETVLYIWDGEISSTMEYISAAYVITIPTTKESNQVSYISCLNYMQYVGTMIRNETDKPIIYLYPKEETEVSVNLGYPEKITCSYPKYINSWNVMAKSNRDLIDLNNGRKLYALYYENEYNYIRFATTDEINENMPLEINPSPDTIIRVLMTYKGLDNPIEIEEQELVTPERTGFVAVEWGGTEIN